MLFEIVCKLKNKDIFKVRHIDNVAINFIQKPGDEWKEAKPSSRDNYCVQQSSPQDKTGSQKVHPWDIKLENFTNVSINSTLFELKNFVVLTKQNGFSFGILIIKAYIIWQSSESNNWMYKSFIWYVWSYINNLLRKKPGWKLYKKNISNFVDSFSVIL